MAILAGIQAFLLKWYGPLLSTAALLTLTLWYIAHFRAIAPKKRTLEWIAFTELPRMRLPEVQPIRGVRWFVLPIAVILGAAESLLHSDSLFSAALLSVALPASAALIFALLLLQLFGQPLTAACGVALLAACSAAEPSAVAALLVIWLLALAVMKQHPAVRVLCLLGVLGAAAALLYLHGCILFGENGISFAVPTFVLPALSKLPPPAIFCGTAFPIVLIAAFRLQSSALLLSALLSLVCIALALFPLPLLACAGCILPLCGTFAAAEYRGTSPVPAALVLFMCIILYSI